MRWCLYVCSHILSPKVVNELQLNLVLEVHTKGCSENLILLVQSNSCFARSLKGSLYILSKVTHCKGIAKWSKTYEVVSKSFRTGRLEREQQMIQLSATSLVSFATVTLSVASQRVFIVVVYFVMTQSGNFWIHAPKFRQDIWNFSDTGNS
jgi:hypothetical protein